MVSSKKCLIIGAGVSGLVAAKELLDVGIGEVTLLEKEADFGGIWLRYRGTNTILTSSKWVTEFGSFPMPNECPDFLTIEQMITYLGAFADRFGLRDRIRYGVVVQAVRARADGKYDVITGGETFEGYDFVVMSTGLHGKPSGMDIPGLDTFKGLVLHGSEYRSAEPFRGKRVLSIGLGESGIMLTAEVSAVASRTLVSSDSFTGASRVIPYTNKAVDQMQFWPLGEYMKDYQEVLTVGLSWYHRLPKALAQKFARMHLFMRFYPQEWLPKAAIPYRWHAKFWPKPGRQYQQFSGNLTRPDLVTDDVLWLVHTGRVQAKGRVECFDETSVWFADGSREEIDAVVVNAGFKPTVLSIEFPGGWQYRHVELYKGCFHPDIPNLAFVGMVRPTIGSIPAMAEMQARLVAQVFAGNVRLPEPTRLRQIIQEESGKHSVECPTMADRLPHVYFFERWMDEVADLIGCRPRARDHMGSFLQLQAYWLGASMPLRFRLRGPGAVKDGCERYARRVQRTYQGRLGAALRAQILLRFLYPHVLSLVLAATLYWNKGLSAALSLGIAALFWFLYMKVELFRFTVSLPFTLPLLRFNAPSWDQFPNAAPDEVPTYAAPAGCQVDAENVGRGASGGRPR
jgi:dimethylaniline monooxygenase (N-oxide forming)